MLCHVYVFFLDQYQQYFFFKLIFLAYLIFLSCLPITAISKLFEVSRNTTRDFKGT